MGPSMLGYDGDYFVNSFILVDIRVNWQVVKPYVLLPMGKVQESPNRIQILKIYRFLLSSTYFCSINVLPTVFGQNILPV